MIACLGRETFGWLGPIPRAGAGFATVIVGDLCLIRPLVVGLLAALAEPIDFTGDYSDTMPINSRTVPYTLSL